MLLPDAFYDECDLLGVLLLHDMQYAQAGHAPRVTLTQEAELRHKIRRLSHHPAIVAWDGCNECAVHMAGSTAIYATFVMTVVAEEDASRVVWPSCPANGWKTGAHKLSQLPNGRPLATPETVPRVIEVHGPYRPGTGFPVVNSADDIKPLDVNFPAEFEVSETGVAVNSIFASEFGATGTSSFEAAAPTLDPAHWSLHVGQKADTCVTIPGSNDRVCSGTNVMAQRNYPCDSFIFAPFGHRDLNRTGAASFKRQLFECMIGQALVVKQTIEFLRSGNTFGLLVWQLNEIWPTGGWGSVEYGNPRFPGQVIGGRWKPLQYWYKAALFADILASCGAGGVCFVKSDNPRAFSGELLLQMTRFDDGSVSEVLRQELWISAGAGTSTWFTSDAVAAIDGTTHILEAVVLDEGGAVVSHNLIPFATPEKLRLPQANASVVAARGEEEGRSTCRGDSRLRHFDHARAWRLRGQCVPLAAARQNSAFP